VLALSAKDGGALKSRADVCIVVPTSRTDRAQEIHLCIQHAICDAIEATL
jgi:D-sedoheptulose 7-phosphate isomerase